MSHFELGCKFGKLEAKVEQLEIKENKTMADVSKLASDFDTLKIHLAAKFATIQQDYQTLKNQVLSQGTLNPATQQALDDLDNSIVDLDVNVISKFDETNGPGIGEPVNPPVVPTPLP